jgi:hypothetical protein
MWNRDERAGHRRQIGTFTTRTAAGLCLAGAFTLSTSLIAQSGSATSSSGDKSGGTISVSGCVAKSGDKYFLTDAHIDKIPGQADRTLATPTGTTGTTGTTTSSATGTSGSATTGTTTGASSTETVTTGGSPSSSKAPD